MFYPSAKVIIKHPTDSHTILLVKRTVQEKTFYEPAGGRAEINFEKRSAESLEECAIREVQEELGFIISIEQYIGSYYFFWTIDPQKCSSCALFVGNILEIDQNFKNNTDKTELPIEPAWITMDYIIQRKIPIDASQVGLEKLLVQYFQITI